MLPLHRPYAHSGGGYWETIQRISKTQQNQGFKIVYCALQLYKCYEQAQKQNASLKTHNQFG